MTNNSKITSPSKWPDQAVPLYPDGKKFAFSIIDDTDEATLENIRPVYDFLHSLGLRTTKTVWVLPAVDTDARPNRGYTLEDTDYLEYILKLNKWGFEIAFHGARGGDSTRQEIINSLEIFNDTIGYYPRIHINHFINRDNLYWGADKLDCLPLKLLYRLFYDRKKYSGHKPDSEYFWGDIAKKHIEYSVNFSFHNINILTINPAIPYHDPRRKYVNLWFHTSDGGSVTSFNNLLSEDNLDRLERENGVCIVYTHFGKQFCKNGELNQMTKERLQDLVSRDGWFAPASEILDHLNRNRTGPIELSNLKRILLELKWLIEKIIHGSS